ncbi:hypothetical protein N7468_004828 [Penicillium chermesinum]|uniref:Aminoglycoside phosphotransferase domain-containing protein n=1 Tax=Penicillium chermesinum TaxID=63820 RepID=A0A9W9P9A4_9EURO|nr:uncharacterized protein N7468_004828 [Penicillium chermesinum]KAJ5240209.1 hypothetical protein N7468_004828 [Penicillium chermesinum]
MGPADFCGQDEAEYEPAARKAEQDEITKLVDKINISALISRASALRGGLKCSIPHDLQSNATSPPAELRDYILRSEVATLQFLGETQVPVPKVFDFNFCETNPVGVGYILMEKLPGSSLRWSLATPEQRRKVTSQLADVYIELKAHPFTMTGSMHHPGSHDIGPFARESLTEYHDSQMKALGPFFSTEAYFSAHIQLILDLIIRQESYVDRAVDAFLIHRFLLDKVSEACSQSHLDDGKFYLKHADEKGDQILVDDEFNITGIIDWEWAHTDSKSAAFNSPIVLLPVADFYAGENSISEDETFFAECFEAKGHPDLGLIVRNGRLIHRFRFCCGYDLADWDGFLGLFAGLLGAMGITNDFHWEIWKAEALERYKYDHQLQKVIEIYN